MIKIIHISDLHIGHKRQNMEARFESIVENIIREVKPPEDHVILVTGDLVENATNPDNFFRVKQYLDKLGSTGFTILVVNGNHDYGTGAKADARYMRQFKALFYGDEQFVFPKLDIVGDIAFIGLDTMEAELSTFDKFGANGKLGITQREGLDYLLDTDEIRRCRHRVVYLHHHPFDPWILHELKDSKELGAILKKHRNIDAIFFGHNHHFRRWNGKWGIARCYDGGSSTRKDNMPSRIRVIDFSRPPKEDEEIDFLYNQHLLTPSRGIQRWIESVMRKMRRSKR